MDTRKQQLEDAIQKIKKNQEGGAPEHDLIMAMFSNTEDFSILSKDTDLYNQFYQLYEKSIELMASGLIALDHKLISEIDSTEYSSKEKEKPTLTKKTAESTRVSNLVAEDILSSAKTYGVRNARDIKDVVLHIEYWINVAYQCLRHPEIQDLNAAMMIMSGLSQSSILRIILSDPGNPKSEARAIFSEDSIRKFEELRATTSADFSYKSQRDFVKSTPNGVPFLGVLETDMTFIRDGGAPTSMVYESAAQNKKVIDRIKTTKISSVKIPLVVESKPTTDDNSRYAYSTAVYERKQSQERDAQIIGSMKEVRKKNSSAKKQFESDKKSASRKATPPTMPTLAPLSQKDFEGSTTPTSKYLVVINAEDVAWGQSLRSAGYVVAVVLKNEDTIERKKLEDAGFTVVVNSKDIEDILKVENERRAGINKDEKLKMDEKDRQKDLLAKETQKEIASISGQICTEHNKKAGPNPIDSSQVIFLHGYAAQLNRLDMRQYEGGETFLRQNPLNTAFALVFQIASNPKLVSDYKRYIDIIEKMQLAARLGSQVSHHGLTPDDEKFKKDMENQIRFLTVAANQITDTVALKSFFATEVPDPRNPSKPIKIGALLPKLRIDEKQDFEACIHFWDPQRIPSQDLKEQSLRSSGGSIGHSPLTTPKSSPLVSRKDTPSILASDVQLVDSPKGTPTGSPELQRRKDSQPNTSGWKSVSKPSEDALRRKVLTSSLGTSESPRDSLEKDKEKDSKVSSGKKDSRHLATGFNTTELQAALEQEKLKQETQSTETAKTGWVRPKRPQLSPTSSPVVSRPDSPVSSVLETQKKDTKDSLSPSDPHASSQNHGLSGSKSSLIHELELKQQELQRKKDAAKKDKEVEDDHESPHATGH